ncbi:MAG: crossover junction endodeoxyribonuclease RuvC [Tissierellia bacterium]|nr:crossover junction endodeoxyribonuclease RuvC [Tissierellia bacterium]
MRILGIDPGLAIVGYSILDVEGNRMKAANYGVIETASTMDFPDRLKFLYEELNLIIKKYKPDEVAIEELFFNKNVKTAIKVGHARGVEILSASMNGLEIYEYTPLQIKNAITGYGRAEKNQIQEMVKILLNLSEIPKPDDAADALAVAITHFHSLKHKEEFILR